jgi:hypothetical protein
LLAISASNSPTSYAATPLPAGLSINTVTGHITGTPTEGGTITTEITATNGSGTSAAKTVVWQVQEGAVGIGEWSDLELDFDLVTREVTIPEVDKQENDVVITLLTRDSINLLVGFKKWGQLQEVDVDADQARVSFSLKEFEPEQVITLAQEDVVVVGEGATSRYRVPLSISRQQWNLLSSYEDDEQTSVRAVGSIELEIGYTGYNDTETASIASVNAGIGAGEMTGTLVFTGMDTAESPMNFDLTLRVNVSGRPNQTVELSRTFVATWGGSAWGISSLAGTSSGSGTLESPWQITLSNTGVTGDSNSIDVAYQITTTGTTPVGERQWTVAAANTGGDFQDAGSSIAFTPNPILFIKDAGGSLIGSYDFDTYPWTSGTPADFFTAFETAWDTIMGTTGELVFIEGSSSYSFVFRVSDTSLAKSIAWDSVDPPGSYTDGTEIPNTSGESGGTVSATLLSEPTVPPLRFTSQPFFTRVVRDWLNDIPTPSLSSSPSPTVTPSPCVSPSLSASTSVSTSSSASLSPSPSTNPSVSPTVSTAPSGSSSASPTVSTAPSSSTSTDPSGSVSFSTSPSVSTDPSFSPSVSTDPSLSPSVSPSQTSPSPSVSTDPSLSPSTNPSPSYSPSPSAPSVSPSILPSYSVSPSVSPSL